MTSIGTYGFRGEALASISHIAHLTITTKTRESSAAYKAHYAGGKLAPAKPGQNADPKPCAGRQGTQIQVEDLFYNVPQRMRAFRSASEEYAKILDLVGRYAVHCEGVAFSCKKHGESGAGLAVPSTASVVDRIRLVHNSAIANDLLSVEMANENLGFRCNGMVSSANYSGKRTSFLLFINHRSVESSAIKKAIDQTYQQFLPRGGHPFIYLSLDIDPAKVDVNVHPTKREVAFLNEEDIIELVCDEIRSKLGKVDTSRTFMTQSLLSTKKPTQAGGDNQPAVHVPILSTERSDGSDKNQRTPTPRTAQKPYENNLVRVDSQVRKITSMLPPAQRLSSPNKPVDEAEVEDMEYEYNEKQPTLCRLTSIKDLRAGVRDDIHNELTNVFSNHTFVGIVDTQRRIAAIQGGVKLYLIDYGAVSNEYFYQLGLTDFGNFGSVRFDPPLDLRELLQTAADHEAKVAGASGADIDWEEVVQMVYDQLLTSKDMLREYFSLSISEDGQLSSIPLLLKGYMPSLAKLPNFLLRLGPHIDWNDEQDCFQSFLKELACFYVPESLPVAPAKQLNEESSMDVDDTQEDIGVTKRRNQIERSVENVLFPAFKARLIATRALRKAVVEVADLKGLYRVFERC